MIKRYKKTLLLGSLVILLPALFGLLLWNRLPDRIVTHWGIDGTPDGWSSKPVAVLALPAFLLLIHWICTLATSADPKNKDFNSKPIYLVLWICPVISVLTSTMVYASALGISVNVNLIMPIFTGLVFILIGNYMPKCKQNYTIGIKVPWTLASVENWNRTHRFAGIVWVIGGVLIMLSAFFPNVFVWMLTVTLLLALSPILYSYLYYLHHEKEQ